MKHHCEDCPTKHRGYYRCYKDKYMPLGHEDCPKFKKWEQESKHKMKAIIKILKDLDKHFKTATLAYALGKIDDVIRESRKLYDEIGNEIVGLPDDFD